MISHHHFGSVGGGPAPPALQSCVLFTLMHAYYLFLQLNGGGGRWRKKSASPLVFLTSEIFSALCKLDKRLKMFLCWTKIENADRERSVPRVCFPWHCWMQQKPMPMTADRRRAPHTLKHRIDFLLVSFHYHLSLSLFIFDHYRFSSALAIRYFYFYLVTVWTMTNAQNKFIPAAEADKRRLVDTCN